MSSRFLAFALVALLVFGASSVALTGSVFAQEDDLWYPGEGVKQDMYVKYKIQEHDANGGQPYEMTIYFKEQQDGDWIVPTFVVDQDKVIPGTMKLADNMAYLAGGSQVPEEMNDYIGGYSGSLHWVDSFTTKSDPKSLTSPNWGRTGSIGGSDLKPSGKETITVPAGEYETTVLILHKGQADSKIWIRNGFPFPIKALFFADTTTGAPETQFEFELLETGMGQPPVPAAGEAAKPPIERKTHSGYLIRMNWTQPIQPQSDATFSIEMYDKERFPLLDVDYDLTVKDSAGQVVKEFKNQKAEVGGAVHEVRFNSAGPGMITVKINAIEGRTTGQFTESADFNVVVVPEFPVSAAIVVAAAIGLVVVMTRGRGTGLGSLFGTKGTP